MTASNAHPTDLTKVSFNAIPRTWTALNTAAARAGLNRTDTLNRAVQTYAEFTGPSLWRAIRRLFVERATVRRLANSLVECETCGDPVFPADLGEHARARHGDS